MPLPSGAAEGRSLRKICRKASETGPGSGGLSPRLGFLDPEPRPLRTGKAIEAPAGAAQPTVRQGLRGSSDEGRPGQEEEGL